MQLFTFDRDRAARSIVDPDGALWPVNAYADADELHALLEAALACRALAPRQPGAHLYVYPMSLAEPEPLLALQPADGSPTLLGHSLKLTEREGENPVDFTLRLLDEVAAEASRLAPSTVSGEREISDAQALDALAARLNEPGDWNGGDVCKLLAGLLQRTGRRLEEESSQ